MKRRNTTFVTTVFRKETFTGNHLNVQSYCGLKRKTLNKDSVSHLICSPEFFEDNIEYFKTLLYKNGYPPELVVKPLNPI